MMTQNSEKTYLDEPRNRLTNDADSNPDPFLAASLQFLYRLLAERTLQNVEFKGNTVPASRMSAEDVPEESYTPRQSCFQQIKQMKEYKSQFRSMEKFVSAIRLAPKKPESISNTTNNGHCRVLEPSAKLHDDSYDFIEQNPCLNCDETPFDIFRETKINTSIIQSSALANSKSQKTEPVGAGDFAGLQIPPDVLTCTNPKENNSVQRSASYVKIVRNAVSGLARYCGKKRKSRRKKCSTNNWLLAAGVIDCSEKEQQQKVYEIEVESEISSEYNIHDEKGSDISKQIPLRIQLVMAGASSRKPITMLVRVPKMMFDLLNHQLSKQNSTIPNEETPASRGKRKKRLTSVFQNLLSNRRTSGSTTVVSTEEKLSSRLTLASVEAGKYPENQENYSSCDTLIYTLRESTSSEHFCETDSEATAEFQNAECGSIKCESIPPPKYVGEYEKVFSDSNRRVISYNTKPQNEKPYGSARRKFGDDKATRTVEISNKTEVVKCLRNYSDREIIPLRCSTDSSQLGNKHEDVSQRELQLFLELAEEMREPQVHRDTNLEHIEIPVRIKTTESPLHLHKSQHVSENLVHGHVFHSQVESRQTPTINGIDTEQVLQMLFETSSDRFYFPPNEYCESLEFPASSHSMQNERRHNPELLENNGISALQFLLRHIATGDVSNNPSAEQCPAEESTTVKLAPRRQLSKISVCSSSESLSGSDHETPEPNITDIFDTHRSNNDRNKSGSSKYFHHRLQASGNKCVNLDSIQAQRKSEPYNRTKVIMEEQTCGSVNGKVKTQVVTESETRSLSTQDTENPFFYHPVLSKHIRGNSKELADAMIRWWGPEMSYSTTPSSQTHVSAYSVSISKFIKYRD